MNLTCNSTLEELRIGSEVTIVGPLNFHQLALIIAGACAAIAIVTSFYLMFQHAMHYTKPREQKHIIRILFMVPVYAASSFLQIWYYWHAVYYQVISDCYEAFAIASFFALMCHYMAPDLHEQKQYFRMMQPIKPWVLPINWMARCCGGERGPWRTPKSGLTWFNIIWIGIYHYCFIRVTMTITAVVTQYFGRYCESSNNPVFAHIWVLVIESIAVTIAMYCVIQFYIQLREPLAEHKPFLKVLAIKLVIFLSFWQSAAISVGTSTLNLVKPNATLAYPDIKVGIPALLLCFEMAIFAILHLWAFPYQPYRENAKSTYYPVPNPSMVAAGMTPKENVHFTPAGGVMGLKAFGDALNLWDIVKAFGRGVRWLFVGVKHRKEDVSYQATRKNSAGQMDEDTGYPMKPFVNDSAAGKSTDHLPIATEFRRSQFGVPSSPADPAQGRGRARGDESAGLIQNAQPDPSGALSPYQPYRSHYQGHPALRDDPYYDGSSAGRSTVQSTYSAGDTIRHEDDGRDQIGTAVPMAAYDGPERIGAAVPMTPYGEQGVVHDMRQQGAAGWDQRHEQDAQFNNPRTSTQLRVGNALWGDRNPQAGPR